MELQARKDQAGKEIPENVWDKWGYAAHRGYQAVPHDLFRFQAQLKLSNGELVTLLNILDFWWEAGKHPFPGVFALAKRMDTTERSIQRHLKTLHDLGYAVRERGNDEKRRFNLGGLVAKLSELVVKDVDEQARSIKG
jgi:predicted transcriptional regulator